MKMSLLILFTFLSIFGCEDNGKDVPAIAPPVNNGTGETVVLTPRLTDYNQIKFQKEGNEWVATTEGHDPYIFFDAPKHVNIKTNFILSIETFNTSESLPLLIYVGNVLDGAHIIESAYSIPRTEGWTINSYDISITWSPPATPFTSLRIRFGNSAGKNFRFRNIVLRQPTEREKELSDKREDLLREDAELTTRLQEYFKKEFASKITSISASYHSTKIQIQGQVSGVTDLTDIGLAEIPMWKDGTKLVEPETFIPLNTSNFVQEIDRIAEDKHDRILSSWAIVKKSASGYELLSNMHYVDEIDPRSQLERMTPRSLKGIGGCALDHQDMTDLNIASVTYNILLDQVLYAESGDGRIPYEYAGKTWYADVNGSHLKGLDRDAKIAYDKGWMVSVILLIPVNRSGDKTSWLGQASHPETESAAAFSMPNFTTKEGAEAYAATISFLTERYGSERRGRIHHWIIHNEIQNGFYWSNAGSKTKETYMNLYQKSMRTVQLLARLIDPNSKTLISLDHDWNRQGDPRGYRGKDCLNLLVDFSTKEGNFEWGIAYHPYAQDINTSRVWEDSQATYRYDTPYLTFKNLEVLDAWTKQSHVLYKGKPREIQFTEQGVNSPDYSEKVLTEQAASMAYIWKKIEAMGDHVTAFQYHLWADAYEEGGLRLGLRKYYNADGDPYGKKEIWYLYQACGEPNWDAVSEKYKAVLGITNWDEVVYKGTIK